MNYANEMDFDKNIEYNKIIYWDLYKKYSSLNNNPNIKGIEKMKKWLENPTGTNLHFDIDEKEYFGKFFHDQIFVIHKNGSIVDFFGEEEHIICENCKCTFLNSVNKEIFNDLDLIKIEGYSDIGVSTKDGLSFEYYLETADNNKIIIL